MMKRMKRFLFYFLVAASAFSVGFVGYRLFITRSSKSKVISSEPPIAFQPSERNKGQQCRALYYGMGNGDGIYNPYCYDLQGQLSDAAGAGDVSRIKELLRQGAYADSYSGDHLPPLYLAASNGRLDAVRVLLDNGANPNRKYTLNGTPLFAAVYENHVDVVGLLLSRGADFSVRNGDETVLKIARKRQFQDIVDLLEAAGAQE
jgi:ankyrin repeat protein